MTFGLIFAFAFFLPLVIISIICAWYWNREEKKTTMNKKRQCFIFHKWKELGILQEDKFRGFKEYLRKCLKCSKIQKVIEDYSPFDDFGVYSGTTKQDITMEELNGFLEQIVKKAVVENMNKQNLWDETVDY